ncbi:MAG: 5-formyltetrahydrofolate cyclo-ligase, partial [Candidatus Omnitrophica bacterium]|nr:5-formyltetrahydrofolate cyclo-ligase [Candidatus Omnitrophota bacterium]
YQQAQNILFYASFKGEVETFDLINTAIDHKKTVALPIADQKTKGLVPVRITNIQKDLSRGSYGILEPHHHPDNIIEVTSLNVVVVPGLAFDRKGNRLGRGAGFYDRFLRSLPSHVCTIGLAFDFQIFDTLPLIEEHDIPLSKIISNG